MPRQSIHPSLYLARLLSQRRRGLGLRLREVARRLAETGTPIPPSTLSRIEQGKTDPGVRRAHRLLKLYRIPVDVAAELVELEETLERHPGEHRDPTRTPEALDTSLREPASRMAPKR